MTVILPRTLYDAPFTNLVRRGMRLLRAPPGFAPRPANRPKRDLVRLVLIEAARSEGVEQTPARQPPPLFVVPLPLRAHGSYFSDSAGVRVPPPRASSLRQPLK